MKAVGLYRHLPVDDPECLVDLELPRPTPEERDLLVRVKAVSVNPVDTKVRMRGPKDKVEEPPRILGWDAAGIVEAVGPESALFKPGDEVYYAGDITRQGCDSEFHLVDERIVGHKPKSLDFAEAASLPLTTLTSWEALFSRLGITEQPAENQGKSILIINAAGGVGSMATQLAKRAGLTVIGTASRSESIQWVKEHGADCTIDHHQPFAPQLKELGNPTIHYIFCLHNLNLHWDNIVETIVPQGKICCIVSPQNPVNLGALMDKSATFAWELMFTRPRFRTADMIEQHHILDTLAGLVDAGEIKTTVTQRLSPINAANLRQAHATLEQGKMIGKLVVDKFPGE